MENNRIYDHIFGIGKYLAVGLILTSAGCATYHNTNNNYSQSSEKKGYFKRHWLPANDQELFNQTAAPFFMPLIQGLESASRNSQEQ